ncbi:amino acid adenylation domain-containing protein [Streptomyces sp. SAI-170]|uniref:non-ribosomal peptide synthetase n=1 Tax=Streptomyces sp. SAI-170 TaxID=3377729 RepID=UPI003C7EB455
MSLDSPDDDITAWLRSRPRRATMPHADRSRPLIASTAQRRLWFDHQLRSQADPDGGTVYHSTLALRLREGVDAAALQAAVESLVARHESLRTRYSLASDGVLHQLVDAAGPLKLHVEDCGGDEEVRRARMAEFFAAGFDLERGPLLRAGLFTLTDRDHIVFLVIHHIATDGWSMDLLHRELGELYRSPTADLAELAHQYADFAAWEQSEFERGAFADALAHWREHLAGAPQALPFPTDLPRPADRTFAAGCHPFEIPAATVAGLERIARDCEASVFQTLLAAFQVLLARWTGQPDLIVGSVAANRRSAETEPIVGLFVNLLPLRGRVDESEPFARLVARTRDTVLDAYDHQGVSFDRLVEAVAPTRAPGHNPLVQAVFTLAEPVPGTESAWGERLEFRETTRTQFDLTFAAGPGEGGALAVDAHFAADLFTPRAIAGLAQRFVALLEELTRSPGTSLSLIPTVTDREAAELDAFATGAPAGEPPLVLDLFDRQVRERPDAEAVVDGATRLSYAQLDAEVDRVAALMASRLTTPATPVGVCLPRSAAQIAALLGVLRAGAVYLPLDPAYPAERLDHLLRDSGCPLVLTDDTTRSRPEWPAHVELLDVSTPSSAAQPGPDVRPLQPAYVIYTSGSTGRPKGVLVTHEGIGNFVSWYVDHYALTPDDRLSQLASPSFDAGLLDTLPALAAGATLTVLPDEARLDTGRLWDRLADAGVTVAFLTTPLFAAAAAAATKPTAAAPEALPSAAPSLRSVQIGGDSLAGVPPELPFTLDNLYGPTEATIAASCGRLEPGGAVHIGGPLRGMRVRVLDAWLRPVPVGTPGEVFLAGPGVALGYLGRTGLTAGRFVPDPWAGDGSRMYRTGDRARWRADGRLEYLGRTDAQVKVRGHRIEPGEIEAVLAAHPGVTEAAVALRTPPGGEPQLCAYVCLGAGADLDAVRAHTERALPVWMHPAAYTVLAELPLTANGKVDRAALPAPEFRAAAAYRAPSGPIEELVAEVWQEVLGVERVGAQDDFFRIGGHSLLATRVLSRLTDLSGCRLPLRTVFDHPVLADLARELEEAVVAAATADG